MFTTKRGFIVFSILFILAIFGPAGIIATFVGSPAVKAAQPRSAKIAYDTGDKGYMVYCEEPNGNEVYVVVNPVAGGAGIYVVPGGCK